MAGCFGFADVTLSLFHEVRIQLADNLSSGRTLLSPGAKQSQLMPNSSVHDVETTFRLLSEGLLKQRCAGGKIALEES